MPDLNKFSEYILEEANALEADILAFQKKGKKKKPAPAPKKTKSEADLFFEFVRKFLKDNPTFLKKPVGLFQFNVSGPQPSDWQLNLTKKPGSVRKGIAKSPDVIVKVKEEHLLKIARKKLNVATAFVQGRIKLDGDSQIGMKLAAILGQLPTYDK